MRILLSIIFSCKICLALFNLSLHGAAYIGCMLLIRSNYQIKSILWKPPKETKTWKYPCCANKHQIGQWVMEFTLNKLGQRIGCYYSACCRSAYAWYLTIALVNAMFRLVVTKLNCDYKTATTPICENRLSSNLLTSS